MAAVHRLMRQIGRSISASGLAPLSIQSIVHHSHNITRTSTFRYLQTYPSDLLYTSTQTIPTGVSRSVSLQHVPGKGISLVACSLIKPGDDIMVVNPMACIHGPADDMPSPDSLVPLLQHVRHAQGVQWLRLLFQGPNVPKHGQQDAAARLERLRGLLHQPLTTDGDDTAQDAVQNSSSAVPPSHEALEQIVAYNAFGDAYEDLAAHECRASRASGDSTDPAKAIQDNPARSHVGIWPQFALLNHSCLPNCVHYVMGSTMVVRAVADINVGQEVSISYLGREDFSPARTRQLLLLNRYGFTCNCPRCQLEGYLPEPLSQLISAIHNDTKINLGPALLKAVEDEDWKALDKVGTSLVEWSSVLHDALTDFKEQVEGRGDTDTAATDDKFNTRQHTASTKSAFASGDGRLYASTAAADLQQLRDAVKAVGGVDAAVLCLEAAIYDFFELLHQHAALSHNAKDCGPGQHCENNQNPEPKEGSIAALKLCADILHAVSRGSELHVFQMARLLSLALSNQTNSVLGENDSINAAQATEEALCCRYGHISPELMKEMAQRNAKISEQFLV